MYFPHVGQILFIHISLYLLSIYLSVFSSVYLLYLSILLIFICLVFLENIYFSLKNSFIKKKSPSVLKNFYWEWVFRAIYNLKDYRPDILYSSVSQFASQLITYSFHVFTVHLIIYVLCYEQRRKGDGGVFFDF